MIARKRAGLPSLQLGGKDFNQTSLPNIAPCTAEEDIEPLPDSFFTQVPDLTKGFIIIHFDQYNKVVYI